MIYLDYSETTPVSMDALDTYSKVSKEYIGSIYASNLIGQKAQNLYEKATQEIAEMFNVMEDEIIYTSGGSEANNMAIIGVALANHKKGKHIIVSKLETPSLYEICKYLESIGFEISYVNNDSDGLISFDDLRNMIREDTILVSISAVNYQTGVRQPLKMLRQIIKKENPNTVFHSDLTQAIGKTQINFHDIDLGSISSHKFYGPKGVGFLYKNNTIKIAPLLYGNKFYKYKPVGGALPLIVSMKDALKSAIKDLDKKEHYIVLLNERITSKLSKLEGIKINKTKYSLPHILNISLGKVSAYEMMQKLGEKNIFVSSNSSNEINQSVMALYNDKERSSSCLRISLSHLTTVLEINRFLEIFEVEYKKLSS